MTRLAARAVIASVLACLLGGIPASAQPDAPSERVLAQSTIDLPGLSAPLRVEVETRPVIAEADGPVASAGTIAYLHPDTESRRPVIFAFNGGPGASSAFLHMGVLGPVIARAPADPSAELPDTFATDPADPALLDHSDVVMIDPPGTGFAERAEGEPGAFNTVAGDARAAAQLVRDWLVDHDRMDAPVYILGESYGTIRAVAMLDALADPSARRDPAGPGTQYRRDLTAS